MTSRENSKAPAASESGSASAAAVLDPKAEPLITVTLETGLRGISRGYEYAEGHPARWDHDGTDTPAETKLNRDWWAANKKAIQATVQRRMPKARFTTQEG